MITQVEIKGFRSFSQESSQKILLQPFTVIVGENDSGKSNLLRAIEFVLNPSSKNIRREDFNIRRSRTSSGKFSDKKAVQIEIALYFSDKKYLSPEFKTSPYFADSSQNGFSLKCVASGHDEATYKKEYSLNDIEIDAGNVEKLLANLSFKVTPAIRDATYLNTLRELLPKTRSSTIRQRIIEISQEICDKLDGAKKIIENASDSDSVSIRPRVDVADFINDLDFDFSITKNKIPLPLSFHGQGMASKIILSLLIARKGLGIGIEEPEIHLHPNLLREFVFLCEKWAKKGKQILIVTHSPYLLNYTSINNVLFARNEANHTRIKAIVPANEDLRQKIQNDIFFKNRKGEILFSKGVMFVEGVYDRQVLSAIGMNLPAREQTFSSGITIVEVGSDTNFSCYVELCLCAGIPWIIVADKKAVYVPENDAPGNFCNNFLSKHVQKSSIESLVERIKRGQRFAGAQRKINTELHKIKGQVYILSGDDISDTLKGIVDRSTNENVLRDLARDFGRPNPAATISDIKTTIKDKLSRKKEEMVLVAKKMGTGNELHSLLKKASAYLRGG